uniref:UPAR/Ly6 domain-containing protein n=1 Tax=Gouania willdenowi TaxID=441366 RepID=A0A8C5EKP7_GOUWI
SGSLALRSMLQLLWFFILLPSLLGRNLICYYSPILEKDTVYQPLMTECLPTEVCFKAVGQYGRHKGLTARGCRRQRDCNQRDSLRFKGTLYTMSYTCCESAYCNFSKGVRGRHLSIAVALVVGVVNVDSW